jgi:hypothetical protein
MASHVGGGEHGLAGLVCRVELRRSAVPFSRADLNMRAACHPEDANLKSFDEPG